MRRSRRIFWLIFSGLFLFSTGILSGQNGQSQYVRRFQNGAQLYHLQRWHEATIEFRRAQEMAANNFDWAQAIYWVILSQLANTDYGSALRDMDELQRIAPNTTFARDMVYHRARIYFNQGYFEDAFVLFNRYINSTGDTDRESQDRRAAAFFWMGESLYAMGQLDDAEKFYAWVIGRYPSSPKIEAASYRIDLIKQKKIEAELLALLQWSHEESLRTSEEFQRTIRTYEHTLNIYQRRIAELTNTINFPDTNIEPENGLPEIISNIDNNAVPGANTPGEMIIQNQDELLVERARQLGSNVQEILREHSAGGN